MVERTRLLERKLSDAMHRQLTRRFVNKRTRVPMRGLLKDGRHRMWRWSQLVQ